MYVSFVSKTGTPKLIASLTNKQWNNNFIGIMTRSQFHGVIVNHRHSKNAAEIFTVECVNLCCRWGNVWLRAVRWVWQNTGIWYVHINNYHIKLTFNIESTFRWCKFKFELTLCALYNFIWRRLRVKYINIYRWKKRKPTPDVRHTCGRMIFQMYGKICVSNCWTVQFDWKPKNCSSNSVEPVSNWRIQLILLLIRLKWLRIFFVGRKDHICCEFVQMQRKLIVKCPNLMYKYIH